MGSYPGPPDPGTQGVGAVGGELAQSILLTTRSMPVMTWVVTLALLLVSSASKMALFGSTVTTLVIGPSVGGATSRMVNDSVAAGATSGFVQTSTLPVGRPGPAGQSKLLPGP